MKQEPTDESVIRRTLFGHCQYGPQDLDKHECQARFQRWFFGKTKVGRKTVDGLIFLDEYYQCVCMCHVPVEDRPIPKKRRSQTKKTVKKRTTTKKATK